ncbi:hypothetical protein V8G54_015892 [Vigna mungo]|uniref:Uncharacterized protein n=1 Tax=Vigna mungo TaxID=3915 RepID=A0AAQ3NN06_VIGMU
MNNCTIRGHVRPAKPILLHLITNHHNLIHIPITAQTIQQRVVCNNIRPNPLQNHRPPQPNRLPHSPSKEMPFHQRTKSVSIRPATSPYHLPENSERQLNLPNIRKATNDTRVTHNIRINPFPHHLIHQTKHLPNSPLLAQSTNQSIANRHHILHPISLRRLPRLIHPTIPTHSRHNSRVTDLIRDTPSIGHFHKQLAGTIHLPIFTQCLQKNIVSKHIRLQPFTLHVLINSPNDVKPVFSFTNKRIEQVVVNFHSGLTPKLLDPVKQLQSPLTQPSSLVRVQNAYEQALRTGDAFDFHLLKEIMNVIDLDVAASEFLDHDVVG